MRKLLTISITVFLCGMMSSTYANEADELIVKLSAARESLLTLILHKDMRGEQQQQVVRNTANAVSAHLEKMTVPANKIAQYKELVETWSAFKETREKELVPAILNGNNELAMKIFAGIQKERALKCRNLAKEITR